MSPTKHETLEAICRRISLNLPENCAWQWDREFNLALAVIDKKDEIMVELPLTLEFSHKWDFATIGEADAAMRDFLQAGLGIVPGQKVFAMDPLDGMVLYAIWWPWGDDQRVSLRLGLVDPSGQKLENAAAKNLICRWLELNDQSGTP